MVRVALSGIVILFCVVTTCHGKCSKILQKGVSKEEESIIVKEHNDIRNKIAEGKLSGQPKGKGFKIMKYDSALAKEAQKIADSCEFEHQDVNDDRWSVGQNLYTSMHSNLRKGSKWSDAVQSWISEHKDYKYGGPVNYLNGHYTQVIWADSEYIGCGYTVYQDPKERVFKYKKLYVCNYGPAFG